MNASTATTSVSPPRSRRWLGHPGLWLGLALMLAGALVARAVSTPRKPLPPVLHSVAPFLLIDQRGQPFSSATLKGQVWVANFIFTRCPTICPVLTGRMIELQRRTVELGDALRMVSFTVDPEYDTPEVLARYAEKNGANPRRWSFLTGARPELQRTLVESLRVSMTREGPADDLMGIGHAGHFVLVDRELRIRGYYATQDREALERLLSDAAALVNE